MKRARCVVENQRACKDDDAHIKRHLKRSETKYFGFNLCMSRKMYTGIIEIKFDFDVHFLDIRHQFQNTIMKLLLTYLTLCIHQAGFMFSLMNCDF